jgi:hypothetical protein
MMGRARGGRLWRLQNPDAGVKNVKPAAFAAALAETFERLIVAVSFVTVEKYVSRDGRGDEEERQSTLRGVSSERGEVGRELLPNLSCDVHAEMENDTSDDAGAAS